MQQVLKLILILMITTTCGQNNEDTTITPPEDEEGSTVVASQEDSPSLPPSHKAVGLSDKDRKELGNMVLVDLLCVKLNPTVIPSCVINRKKLDAFLLMKKHLLGTHQIPESVGNGIPPSSTPHSRSTEGEPVGTAEMIHWEGNMKTGPKWAVNKIHDLLYTELVIPALFFQTAISRERNEIL